MDTNVKVDTRQVAIGLLKESLRSGTKRANKKNRRKGGKVAKTSENGFVTYYYLTDWDRQKKIQELQKLESGLK